MELRQGRTPASEIPLETLAPERAEPIAHMIDVIRHKKPMSGMVALDINVDVVEIMDAARQSVKTGAAVRLK